MFTAAAAMLVVTGFGPGALQTKDALLVDIRSDADRSAQGVPALAKGALGKGAAVPVFKLGDARSK